MATPAISLCTGFGNVNIFSETRDKLFCVLDRDIEVFALCDKSLRLLLRSGLHARSRGLRDPSRRGRALLGEFNEALVLPRRSVLVRSPELRITHCKHSWLRLNDDFGAQSAAWTQLNELFDVAVDADVTFAGAAPPHRSSGLRHPHVGISDVAGQNVGR